MTGYWFEFLQEKGSKKGLMNCKINNHQGCHLDDHYKWNYHHHDMQLESLNSVAKFMKEGFSDNNSVIRTAIKYSCKPDIYLISTVLILLFMHIPVYTLDQTEIMLITLNCWILWILLLVIEFPMDKNMQIQHRFESIEKSKWSMEWFIQWLLLVHFSWHSWTHGGLMLNLNTLASLIQSMAW